MLKKRSDANRENRKYILYWCLFLVIYITVSLYIGPKISYFFWYIEKHYYLLLEFIIIIPIIIILYISIFYTWKRRWKLRINIEKRVKNKKRLKKDIYFIRKVQRLELIKIAIYLHNKWKYLDSNFIYNILLRERKKWDQIDDIYSNIWWNYIKLSNYDKALTYFREWIKLNNNNELIHEWIDYIYNIKRREEKL